MENKIYIVGEEFRIYGLQKIDLWALGWDSKVDENKEEYWGTYLEERAHVTAYLMGVNFELYNPAPISR